MEKKISPYQLTATMFVLPYGSAILFLLGSEVKQDAWLAVLIYILPAILLVMVYIKLFKFYPQDTLITCFPKLFGKYLGYLLGYLYVIYFAYIATRVLRDFSSLIVYSTMTQTPHLFIGTMIMLTVIYGVSVGIETLCRAAGMLFPLMILGLISAILFLLGTRNVLFFERVLPTLEFGPTYLIARTWRLITFPYGEVIAFTMLFNNVNDHKKIKKYAIIAVITEGIVLSIITLLYIAALGTNYAAITNFPLLETLRLIKIGGFLERLDILIIVTMVVAGFMKISLLMYFSIHGLGQLLKMNSSKKLVIPIGFCILICSELIARSFSEHVKLGLQFTTKYIHVPMQIFIPIAALIIAYFKNKNKKPSKSKC